MDCYVLDDEKKTAVVSQRGMAAAIGLAERGNAFVRFANSRSIALHGGAQLLEKIANPFVFTWGTGGAQQPPSEVNGYDVTLLIDVCKAITKAADAGDLSPNQAHLLKQAHVIINASAKAGITGLVYTDTIPSRVRDGVWRRTSDGLAIGLSDDVGHIRTRRRSPIESRHQ